MRRRAGSPVRVPRAEAARRISASAGCSCTTFKSARGRMWRAQAAVHGSGAPRAPARMLMSQGKQAPWSLSSLG